MEDDEISSSSSSEVPSISSNASDKDEDVDNQDERVDHGHVSQEDDEREDDEREDDEREDDEREEDEREDDERGDDSSRSPKSPPVQSIRHECDMPSTSFEVGSDLFYVRLPNFLSIQSKEYDEEYYDDEIYDEDVQDNEGRTKLKLKVENTIRWRKVRNDDGEEEIQSNARIVKWSDGTQSLYLGSEIFDLDENAIGQCIHLYVRQGKHQGLQGSTIFEKKLSIRPHSTESLTHRKLTLSLADQSQKTNRIRMLNNPGQDPEQRLSELSKQEDDKFKASLRRETKQRRIQERSQIRGPNASYLEPDMDEEDEDGAISLAAIKRGVKNAYDESDEQSNDDIDDYSDDSDPEFGKIKRKSERKKQTVVHESDDD